MMMVPHPGFFAAVGFYFFGVACIHTRKITSDFFCLSFCNAERVMGITFGLPVRHGTKLILVLVSAVRGWQRHHFKEQS